MNGRRGMEDEAWVKKYERIMEEEGWRKYGEGSMEAGTVAIERALTRYYCYIGMYKRQGSLYSILKTT